ncbi:cysteine hydrolase family protein [Polynucleobacter kasalickyi]|uniref:Nicotinamidase-related amidase n=1 Tax=Polynucleobacter kasalickyi TaxID=1938817 RepID=A0A1W1Z867_9BURK|nr:isochorismatase family cysteine hydrolase [Polynucleobacter kasalickyi]SMC44118.1 Nicotinamidase-related amidase [Polynucleobacter kasalickyi]
MKTILAKPYDFPLDPKSCALVVIDMQRDFVESGGFGEALGNDVSILQEIVPTVEQLLALWREGSGLVIHTREVHLPDLSNCPPAKIRRGNLKTKIGDQGPMGRLLVAGEYGSEIIESLMPLEGEIVIDKPGKGAFYNTDLGKILLEKGITQLIIVGVTTEVCVQTTMREANDRGFDCLLIEDATASYFPDFKQSTIDMIVAQGGIVGWSTPFANLLQGIKS